MQNSVKNKIESNIVKIENILCQTYWWKSRTLLCVSWEARDKKQRGFSTCFILYISRKVSLVTKTAIWRTSRCLLIYSTRNEKKTVCPIIEWKLSFVNKDHWLYWMLVCFFQSGKGAIIKRLLCSHRPNFFNTPWFSLYFPICFSHFLGPKSTSAPTGCRTGESTSLLVPGDVGPDLTRVPCPSKHIGTYGNIWNLYRPYIWSGGNKHMISR